MLAFQPDMRAPSLNLQVAGWFQILLVICCSDMLQQLCHAVRCAGTNNSNCWPTVFMLHDIS